MFVKFAPAVVSLCTAAVCSAGALSFSDVLTDHAVLQRDIPCPVWGDAAPSSTVTVRLNGLTVATAKADSNGCWRVDLPAQKANATPSRLTAQCGSEEVALEDILFGDVWFGCGQSNMAYTFNGYGRNPVGGLEFVAQATNRLIRTLTMNTPFAGIAQRKAPGVRWRVSDPNDPDSVRNTSAALYWFGDKLFREIGVPIGLVNASYGATKIDGWLDPAYLLLPQADPITRGYGQWYEDRRKNWIDRGGRERYAKELWDYNAKFNPGGNMFPKDGKPTLHDLEFDTSALTPITLPCAGFQHAPFPERFKGEVWLRATFKLRKEQLEPYVIAYFVANQRGNDCVFVNGKAIGGSGSPTHGFGIPLESLREGSNVVVVKLNVWDGPIGSPTEGGLHTPPAIRHNRGAWADIPLTNWLVALPKAAPTYKDRAPDNLEAVNMFSMAAMHHGRVAPLYPMAIKGAIWYQGCSDLGNWKYPGFFRSLVGGWRHYFTFAGKGQSETALPVIITEIAPHKLDTKPNSEERLAQGDGDRPTWSVSADMRRMLAELGESVPNCAAISLLDLGESDIHPVRKEQVGERWMRLALSRAYGIRKGLEAGPVLERVEWNGPRAILHFRNADGLQTSDGKPVKGFELAGPPQTGVTIDGADRKKDGKAVFGCIYHIAKAEIKGNTVILSAPEVREAFSLRYAWFDLNPGWNLVNREQLPANTLRRFKDGIYHEQVYDSHDILKRKGVKQ